MNDPDYGMWGFYLATLGFDQDFDDFHPGRGVEMVEHAKKDMPHTKSVLDIIETPEVRDSKTGKIMTGQEWWSHYGTTMHYAYFDLTPDSRSLHRWANYLDWKQNRGS